MWGRGPALYKQNYYYYKIKVVAERPCVLNYFNVQI
jgi:hypothetical protein